MKHLLLTTIAAVLLVGCGTTQSPVTYLAAPHWTSPKPPTAKAPDISINQAVFDGNIEAVKQHLAAGTDVNAKDDNGWTPLHFAVYYGHKEIVELLIAKGADVNAKDNNGWTPLHFAAGRDHKEIVELLIAKGANVNAKDNNGWTPLFYAAAKTGSGHKEIVELLIVNDADVNALSVNGKTPLDWANDEIAALLRKHGGKTKKELEAEAKK